MLHKVTIGYFRLYEDGRKRPDFYNVIVEADTGDEAASAALVAYGNKCPDQAPETRTGVHGIDVPTQEEIDAFFGEEPKAEAPKRGRKTA